VKTMPHAFDGIIKTSFQPHFERWRSNADEEKVRVVADACRTLRNFVTDKGPPTCYKDMFPRYNAEFIKPPKEITNVKNLSGVPLGNLYSGSNDEAIASHARLQEDLLATAIKKSHSVRGGEFGDKLTGSLCTYAPDPRASEKNFLQSSVAPANGWKSELKHSFSTEAHSSRQLLRYGARPTRKGASAWLECAATPTKRVLPAVMIERSQSAPALNMRL